MLHRKPQSLRKKTHVWPLKTYLFFLGGSKILKIKGSVIEMSLLFWCCLTLENLCIIKLFILWYPLHPIPLSSLTSLSWSIPVIYQVSICNWEYSHLSFLEIHVHEIWDLIPFHGRSQGGWSHRAVDTTRVLAGQDHVCQKLQPVRTLCGNIKIFSNSVIIM